MGFIAFYYKPNIMNNFFKTIIAGYGASKLGGGCFSTIIIFILIYMALGHCGEQRVQTTDAHHPQTEMFAGSGK